MAIRKIRVVMFLGTEWEAAAKKRLMMHDMYPENVSYR